MVLIFGNGFCSNVLVLGDLARRFLVRQLQQALLQQVMHVSGEGE
jgi:hypothetical protein